MFSYSKLLLAILNYILLPNFKFVALTSSEIKCGQTKITIVFSFIRYYSGTPLNNQLRITTAPIFRPLSKVPLNYVIIDISINKFQKYNHPEITAIFFGPMGGHNSEVPLYLIMSELNIIQTLRI